MSMLQMTQALRKEAENAENVDVPVLRHCCGGSGVAGLFQPDAYPRSDPDATAHGGAHSHPGSGAYPGSRSYSDAGAYLNAGTYPGA